MMKQKRAHDSQIVRAKAIYIQLEACLVKNNIIYNYQSWFRSSFSTDTCFIHLLDHIKNKNATSLYIGMVLLDLQKVFGTVDHNILCNKLKFMGVRSTKWFESYLGNRSQYWKNVIRLSSCNLWCPSREHFGAFVILVLCQRHGD